MCSHVTIVPPLRALLESPDLRLDGFIGPGHVSTVVGARPFEFIPADYGKPVVIAGFEPLDILQAISMILRQLQEGRCEVENEYKRVVPYEGNLRALEVMAEVFELRPHFEWRGLGFISHSGLKLSEAYAELDAEQRFSVPGVRVADPKACQCGEVLKGVIKPWECKVFGTALHAGAPDRHVHGLLGGRVRGVLQLRPLRARARGRVMTRRLRSRAEDPRDHRDRPRPSARSSATQQINMAHGAGGKATQTLIEGLFVPAFESAELAELGDAGRVEVDGTELAMTTDSYVVKPLRFPGGSIGELAVNGTVNDLAVSGARPLALTLSLVLEEGLRRRRAALRGRGDRAQRRARPGCRSSPATPRWSSAGAPRACTSARPASAAAIRGRTCPLRRCVPGTGSCCRGASASTAPRSCSRAANSSSTPRSSPTPGRCGRPSTRCSTRPGRSFAACATRPAAASPRC